MKKLILPLLSATLLFACSTQKENEHTVINQTVQKGIGNLVRSENNAYVVAANNVVQPAEQKVYQGVPTYFKNNVSAITQMRDINPSQNILPVSEAVCMNPACAFMDTLCDKQSDNSRQELILSIANSKGGFIEYFEAKPVLNPDNNSIDEFTISFKTICIDKSAFDQRNAWLRKSDYGVN